MMGRQPPRGMAREAERASREAAAAPLEEQLAVVARLVPVGTTVFELRSPQFPQLSQQRGVQSVAIVAEHAFPPRAPRSG